jgi:hypothetical protein
MALGVTKQTNIAVNKSRHLVFFEGTELCYNYKTGQWSEIPAYDGLGMFSVNRKVADIGLVIFSSGSVSLQPQLNTYVPQTALLTTGATDPFEGGRGIIDGVRPIANGGTYAVRAGVQDNIDDAVTWSASTSVNTRSNMANMRSEGRYVRVEITISGGFETFNGADVAFIPQGLV